MFGVDPLSFTVLGAQWTQRLRSFLQFSEVFLYWFSDKFLLWRWNNNHFIIKLCVLGFSVVHIGDGWLISAPLCLRPHLGWLRWLETVGMLSWGHMSGALVLAWFLGSLHVLGVKCPRWFLHLYGLRCLGHLRAGWVSLHATSPCVSHSMAISV